MTDYSKACMQILNSTSLRVAAVLRGKAIPTAIWKMPSVRAHRHTFGAGKNPRSAPRKDLKEFAYTP